MNLEKSYKNIRNSMNLLIDSFFSIIKIIIRSKFNLQLPVAAAESCIVLGNGPSLKQSLARDNETFKKFPLLCVNNFAHTSEFLELKPSYYVLLDPGFFLYKERNDIMETFAVLKNKVNWELTLFIPYIYREDADVKFFINNQSYVKINFYNYVVFNGFKSFGFKLFKNNLAMPQLYNVLGASVFLAINMGYKKIKIAGADHSWFENIEINEENLLCRRDFHFYDKEEQKQPLIPIVDPVSKKTQRLGDFFKALYKVFDSYYLLNEYAFVRKCSVCNISIFSYIDAFKRKVE